VRGLHLDNCSYFVGASLNTFGGDQGAQHFVSCYTKDTPLHVEFEVGLTHVGKGHCQVGDVRLIFLACNYDVVDIRQYIPADLVL
jgi:hypothetical protein